MKSFFLVLLIASFCFEDCVPKKEKKLDKYSVKNSLDCLHGICFNNKPICIDSILEQNDYNGVLIKVYDLKLDKNEIISFDTLIKKGFNKLPFRSEDLSEVPFLLKKYITDNDKGYYFNYIKKTYGNKFVILNVSKNKLILNDVGILEDLLKKDHETGVFPRRTND